MTVNRRAILAGLTLAAVAAGATGLAATATESADASPEQPTAPSAMHADPWALEQAMLDAFRAALRDDVDALADALERVDGGTQRLERATAGRYEPLVGMSRGYEAALEVTVEAARDGDLSTSRKQFYFVYIGCRECHVLAREGGLLANAPLGASR